MPVYRWRDGKWVDKHTGELAPKRAEAHQVRLLGVVGDIEPYRSPISGEVIGGRASKRDDLKRHGCIDSREAYGDSALGGKFKNKRFAAKHGLTADLKEEARD